MMNCSSLLSFLIWQGLSFFLIDLGDDEQIFTTNVQISLDDFNNIKSCLAQGVWTRYNPLSQIPQIGDFGIFDSNCYNIHNVLDQQTGLSNFLYYDCVENESQTIQKIIQFVDNKENQHIFQIDLNSLNYENTWFYFGISIFPIRNKVQIILIQNQDKIFFQDIDIIFPYYDRSLKMTFGGGLALTQNKRIQVFENNLIFSYFPGKMYLNQAYMSDMDYLDFTTHKDIEVSLNSLKIYKCSQSMQEVFSSFILELVNIQTKLIENNFVDSFVFSGWIKAIEIHQIDEQFQYKLIKISSNSDNNRLIDDNLSPFQLLYRFDRNKQFLQILTYSYTFPSVTLDFQQNSFLIKEEFLLAQNISLWHFLSVQFYENNIEVDITFYDKEEQFKLNFAKIVNHFHYVKFKIQFGNLFENSLNYINFKILQFSFIPCRLLISILVCDYSCQSCEGPTKNDCLNCDPQSKRIYLPESKSCVCPENMIEQDNECLTLENQIQKFIKLQNAGFSCQFGYFQFDENTCVKCPSNPEINTQSCLECIQNPETWKLQPTCKLSLFYNKSDNQLYQLLEEQIEVPIFTYDSSNLQLCQNCQTKNLSDIDNIYGSYQLIKDLQDNILKYNIQIDLQYCQSLQNCVRCFLENNDLICSECEFGYSLKNRRCINNFQFQKFCLQPYYLNSRRQCTLCQINYCVYCFEYLQNDLSQSTLYKDFQIFEIDEFHSVGCALCNEGFQFNFLLGLCIYQESKIKNCIRSFINLDAMEICTLSNLQTFDLSPEIDNCQSKISNCKQCIKTPSQIIKCIICGDGYSANIISGKCQICPIENSKICIQGEVFERDAWVQLIQSFIMQFLNKNYFYPKGNKIFIYDYVISCQNGYRPTSLNECLPYCKSDCLRCEEYDDPSLGFQCLECPLNNYNQIQRSTDSITCLKCPKLCSLCQIRSMEEIKAQNPYFFVTDKNVQYTYKCIQRAFNNSTIIDSKLLIAKQIFGKETYILNFNV